MTIQKLAEYFAQLEKTTSRLKITEILSHLLKEASDKEIDKICYLSLGRLAPLYEGIEFNLAEKLMIKVLATAFRLSEEEIRQKFKETGDLGETAFNFKLQRTIFHYKPSALMVLDVYQKLLEIAKESGEGSVERKIEKMTKLIEELDALSAKFVVRIPLGRLRLGFSELTILDALSWMLVGDKSLRERIERAYEVRADVGEIAKNLKLKTAKFKLPLSSSKIEKVIDELGKITPQWGIPVLPALCQRLPTPEEMIKKMGKVVVEPKFDGTRLAIHFRLPKMTRIFTRNLENVTHMFPDIANALPKEIKAKEVILDGEAIGFDPKTGKFLPFQETIKRKRKYEVEEKAKEIPLKYFVFDILFKNGKSLIDLPLYERRKILEETLEKGGKTIVLTPQIITENPDDLRKFHDEQVKAGLEGAVVKKWQSVYEPGRRGYNWVKFKAEKKGKRGGGLADTLDCVVMGYYKGRGKRAQFGIGAFLVGIRRSENSSDFLTISKIGTGLSDEQWRELKEKSKKIETTIQPREYRVDKNLTPDVWCAPALVVEIEADNITISPVHTAGLALRFPRLLRFREDKSPEQATTLAEAKRLYRMQGVP